MTFKPTEWTGRAFRKLGTNLLRNNGLLGTWIDVGAHHGETTIGYANQNPGLRIFAFEPNLAAAATMMGHAANYIVLPMAISETNGCANFNVNAFDAASSFLPLSEDGIRSWDAAKVLKVDAVVPVPTVRLDTFMECFAIDRVDFLKIDAQGTDLAVVRSAGARIKDIARIVLEVWITPQPIYAGVPTKAEIVAHLANCGFALEGAEPQSEGREENLTFINKTGRLS